MIGDMKMKTLILAALLSLPVPAFAYTECAGETYTGTIVKVAVNTVGTMGGVTGANVRIEPKDEPAREYVIEADEIPQFFETVNEDYTRAFVGLSAYVQDNFPVQIRYEGTNFEEDLTKVLRAPGRVKQPNNYLRVWKGPGFAGDQQHSFADVVCSVSLDP
jgi:hypothetical protein